MGTRPRTDHRSRSHPWPTRDPYIPAGFGQAYADALGGETDLEIVEEAGHWSWLDRPELIDRAARFLGQ